MPNSICGVHALSMARCGISFDFCSKVLVHYDLSLHLQRRVLQEYLRTTDLAHVDSHRRRRNWGTWRHPHTHTWYEIDAFQIVSKSLHLALG